MIQNKVLVTGARGQLGIDLVKGLKAQGYAVVGFSREQLNVADLEQVRTVLEQAQPDVVIHAAAYTKVDMAESEPDEAYSVNADGTRNIALVAEDVGAKLVYISTDYVFDGQAIEPYRESDKPSPLNVYGKSKLAGEQVVQEIHSKYFIVRTSWVYGLHGANFVKTMLKLGEERRTLGVVSDQMGSPTYTVDLSRFIGELIADEKYGIYHASNAGSCSWYEFAKAIFTEAGMTDVQVKPIATADFPRPAPRPAFSVMEHGAIHKNGFVDLPPWREALTRFLQEYMQDVRKGF